MFLPSYPPWFGHPEYLMSTRKAPHCPVFSGPLLLRPTHDPVIERPQCLFMPQWREMSHVYVKQAKLQFRTSIFCDEFGISDKNIIVAFLLTKVLLNLFTSIAEMKRLLES
jgi:hypothetical protein